MKLYNSNRGRAKLRREQFNRSQTKSQFKGKKSLSKRIIAERVGSITKDDFEIEFSLVTSAVKIADLVGEVTYHLKFAIDAYPATFNEEKTIEILKELTALRTDFMAGNINTEQYVQKLKDIDNQIMDKINNISKSI